MPQMVGTGGSGRTWATWDENSEALDVAYIVRMENTAAGHEVGYSDDSSLTTADLTATMAGGLAGGDGTKRTFDGANDQFSLTANLTDAAFVGQSDWTIIIKAKIANPIVNENAYLHLYGAGDDFVNLYPNGDALRGGLVDDDNAIEHVQTTNTMTAGTVYYICAWTSQTSGKTRIGFSTTKPTKWSDFAANNRKEFTALFDNFATFDHHRTIGSDAASWIGMDLYYIIFDDTALIGD